MKTKLAAFILGALLLAIPAATAQGAYAPAKNGRLVFYVDPPGLDDGEVHISNADGTGDRILTGTLPGFQNEPAISPNGKLIVFCHSEGGDIDLWGVAPDGSGLRPLLAGPETDCGPTFSPDGRTLAFTRTINPSTIRVMLMDLATGAITPLTSDLGELDAHPEFTPDGSTVLVTSGRNTDNFDIESVPVTGGAFTNLTPSSDSLNDSVSASPRGDRLAWGQFNGEDDDIATAAIDGSAVSVIPSPGVNDTYPAFSPNGKLIAAGAYPEDVPNADVDLVVMNADGTGRRNLEPAVTQASQNQPVWEYIFTCHGKRATIVGDTGPDVIVGTKGRDVIVSNGGRDKIKAGGGKDLVCGGRGADRIKGGGGNDRLYGGRGKDRVSGGPGVDLATGGPPRRAPF